MQTAEIDALVAAQHRDGGWGYGGGSSWTEPTVFVLLALDGEPQAQDSVKRGWAWLRLNQRPDGGFAPRPSVEESTWVTALPVLLAAGDEPSEQRAVSWLLRQTGQETTIIYRLRRWMLGGQADFEPVPGWSWYPGTSSWVVPTSLTLLALRKVERRYRDGRLEERLQQGRRFLLTRRCEDSGWNHGSSRALGFQAGSYPETTGLALLGLADSGARGLELSFARAEQHYRSCRSPEGLSWLELGLLAHGRRVSGGASMPARTPLEIAVAVLAAKARQGRQVLLERA